MPPKTALDHCTLSSAEVQSKFDRFGGGGD